MIVNLYVAAVDLDSSVLETKPVGVSAPSNRDEEFLGGEFAVHVVDFRDRFDGAFFDGCRLKVSAGECLDALLLERLSQLCTYLFVFNRKQSRQQL